MDEVLGVALVEVVLGVPLDELLLCPCRLRLLIRPEPGPRTKPDDEACWSKFSGSTV